MAVEHRGWVPAVRRYTIPATVEERRAPAVTAYLQIYNLGAQIPRVYFTAKDAADDANFIDVAVTSGVWEGPAEVEGLWFKAASATTAIAVVYYKRRG